MNATQISAEFSSTSQLTVEDISQAKAMGFRTIMNCRPDGEDVVNQPASATLQQAAEAQGLSYIHLPITMGSEVAVHAAQAARLLAAAPKPVLGFCKSGMRASNLYLATAK